MAKEPKQQVWEITVETTSDKCPDRTIAKIEGEPDQPWCKRMKELCTEDGCVNIRN